MNDDAAGPPAAEPTPAGTSLKRARISLWAVIAGLVGLLVGTVIVGYYGFGAVAGALETAGWGGLLAIAGLHLVVIALCGIAWWALVPRASGATAPLFIWGRLIRDAGSEVLPLSQIGGYVMGARAATLQGVSGTLAIASTVVDVTMELLSQFAYTALGLGLLLWLHPETKLALPIGIGLLIMAPVTVFFIIAQQRSADLAEDFAARIARQWLGKATEVQESIRAIYRGRRGVRWGFVLHLFCWIASAGEVWVALRFLDAPLNFAAVLAIESSLYAIRSAAFVVPSAVGVQEGAYVMLLGIFGLSPQTALALSLLKRGRDLLLGVPALVLWQSLEGRHLLRRSSDVV